MNKIKQFFTNSKLVQRLKVLWENGAGMLPKAKESFLKSSPKIKIIVVAGLLGVLAMLLFGLLGFAAIAYFVFGVNVLLIVGYVVVLPLELFLLLCVVLLIAHTKQIQGDPKETRPQWPRYVLWITIGMGLLLGTLPLLLTYRNEIWLATKELIANHGLMLVVLAVSATIVASIWKFHDKISLGGTGLTSGIGEKGKWLGKFLVYSGLIAGFVAGCINLIGVQLRLNIWTYMGLGVEITPAMWLYAIAMPIIAFVASQKKNVRWFSAIVGLLFMFNALGEGINILSAEARARRAATPIPATEKEWRLSVVKHDSRTFEPRPDLGYNRYKVAVRQWSTNVIAFQMTFVNKSGQPTVCDFFWDKRESREGIWYQNLPKRQGTWTLEQTGLDRYRGTQKDGMGHVYEMTLETATRDDRL